MVIKLLIKAILHVTLFILAIALLFYGDSYVKNFWPVLACLSSLIILIIIEYSRLCNIELKKLDSKLNESSFKLHVESRWEREKFGTNTPPIETPTERPNGTQKDFNPGTKRRI